MCEILVTGVITLAGTLLGTWFGYHLSSRQSEKLFRRTVLRDIAFEYRRLADTRTSGHIHGLIQAGICQCESNKEYAYVLDLADDLQPKIDAGKDWRPKNGNYVEFFARLKRERMDPINVQQVAKLKNQVEILN